MLDIFSQKRVAIIESYFLSLLNEYFIQILFINLPGLNLSLNMGPKKGGGEAPGKKAVQKQKEKIIEDKTFGLKNKNKSKAVQSYIKSVETTVKGGKSAQAQLNEEFALRAEKKRLKEEEAFLASLSKGVVAVKQAEDDESEGDMNMLCEFFKAGNCEAGDKCKYSHDLNIAFNVSITL
jgi:hypothetical protein